MKPLPLEPQQSDLDHLHWLARAGMESFAGKKILDLGCGTGFICQKAIREGAVLAVGVDLLEPLFSQSPEASGWRFLRADLNEPQVIKELGEIFDLILAFDIIEHLESPYRFLRTCSDLLSKDGVLIMTTPNLMSWERFLKPNRWSGIMDPQHKVLFTKYSLNFLLHRCGFSKGKFLAPLRALDFLGPLQPQIGGQMLSIIQK